MPNPTKWTKTEIARRVQDMLSKKPEALRDGDTQYELVAPGVICEDWQIIPRDTDAIATQIKEDLGPELREAGFSEGEIEQLFKPDRPAH
jgi:hypothetical protein